MVLKNIRNDGHPCPPRKIGVYRVTVYDPQGVKVARREGTCWTTLVREVKKEFGNG